MTSSNTDCPSGMSESDCTTFKTMCDKSNNIFLKCPAEFTSLQTCIKNGSSVISHASEQRTRHMNLILLVPTIINALSALALFFYVLYFAWTRAPAGKNRFLQVVFAFFLQPLYVLHYLINVPKNDL